jgi:hypothetical protein
MRFAFVEQPVFVGEGLNVFSDFARQGSGDAHRIAVWADNMTPVRTGDVQSGRSDKTGQVVDTSPGDQRERAIQLRRERSKSFV